MLLQSKLPPSKLEFLRVKIQNQKNKFIDVDLKSILKVQVFVQVWCLLLIMSYEQLRQWFDAIDQDRNGCLDAMELQRALALGQLHFSLQTVAHMIRIHDRDNNGTISFDEFHRLHGFLINMQNSFRYFDKDKSGELSLAEVHQALLHARFNLDQTAFYTLCRAFDPNRSGTLGLPAYIAMTLFLQSCSDVFNAFDPQRTGRVSMDFNQFIYAASHCV
eukprot:TRINITY_DN32547_c1_g1_i4.p1 TRINITY_DN32547_c1_g1~~TRINITY_DN32547_c1_g1_i4.p1  ORF type:complete len:218 (+),score=0.69 TRINITY_DN32547_c1_g1_i4:2-655(+)